MNKLFSFLIIYRVHLRFAIKNILIRTLFCIFKYGLWSFKFKQKFNFVEKIKLFVNKIKKK